MKAPEDILREHGTFTDFTADEPEELRPPEFTDEAIALQFAERHQNRLLYVAKLSRWMHWDGTRWDQDNTLLAFDLARRACREAATEAMRLSNTSRLSSTMASAKTVAAVERLARSDRRMVATIDEWDSDPWLLNTPAGVLDLRTGIVTKHSPQLRITKITAVAPGGECPLFQDFLSRITDGNVELQNFLGRMFGYAATGSFREHAIFFCYGGGGNGKSVLLTTVASVLGDYAIPAPIETFTASNTDRHPTEVARLHGARLVTATETEKGRPWAEARIKALTSGEKTAARFMRGDFFEFVPIFKLIIAGNHKPILQTVDESTQRRFHLIPFNVTIPPAERDLNLIEKLRPEWPGILQWVIDHCRDWQAMGLNPPRVVTDSTATYLSEQDAIGAWLQECCILGPDCSSRSSDLFSSWRVWAERAGETPGKQKTLSEELQKHGFIRKHTNSGSIFHGLRVIPTMTADER